VNYTSGSFYYKGFLYVLLESPGSILLYSKLLFGYLVYIQKYISPNIARNAKLPIAKQILK